MRHNPAVVGRARAYLLEHRQFTISVITRYEVLRGLKAKGAATRAQLRMDYADAKRFTSARAVVCIACV
jgi:tRNA(fMet)-specific endonuclease VapC